MYNQVTHPSWSVIKPIRLVCTLKNWPKFTSDHLFCNVAIYYDTAFMERKERRKTLTILYRERCETERTIR